MGALRAAEVPGVIGAGLVYQWYRNGLIRRDDEVALLFDPASGRPLTVPTVNVRYASERLSSLGTIDPDLAEPWSRPPWRSPTSNGPTAACSKWRGWRIGPTATT